MLKIGILSMQEVINYGSFLQAYALKQLLETNIDVSYISVFSNLNDNEKRSKFFWLLSKMPKSIADIYQKVCRIRLKSKIIPAQKENFKYENGSYDIVIVGSDEVFNFSQEASWSNDVFLGDGLEYKSICAFSASSGNTGADDLSDSEKERIKKALNNFSFISVRDKNTKDLLQNLGVKEPVITLDPVLLYDFNAEKSKYHWYNGIGKYMIIYSYNFRFKNYNEIREIRQYAQKHRLKVIAVEGCQTWTDKYVAVNPFEIFDLFRQAECVITDTFHGTIIASKMNCKFAIFTRESNKQKLGDLIGRLDLESHVYKVGNLEAILETSTNFDANHAVEEGKIIAQQVIANIMESSKNDI